MWIKIENKMYNTDDFCAIEQIGSATVISCKSGAGLTLPLSIFQRLVALLNPKEVN